MSDQAFGDQIPFADPAWYQPDWNSPYFNDSHRRLRAYTREFVEKHIMPDVQDWSEANDSKWVKPLLKKLADAQLLPGMLGIQPWPSNYTDIKPPCGILPNEWDAFHEMVVQDEIARCASGGVMLGLAGYGIALPPVLHFGSDRLKQKMRDVVDGRKVICLNVTEPGAGSDVSAIKCTAKKTADGKYYIVDGEKKYITNGIFADYFTVAVRTGGQGMGGISLLLIERDVPGISMRLMKMQGGWGSGTTFVIFDQVKVPVENLIGKENNGFKYVMYNFNHERLSGIIHAVRFSRECFHDAIKHAHQREAFGKKLIDNQVVRYKLSNMAKMIEATQGWLNDLVWQIKTMPKEQQLLRLGGPTALLKAQAIQLFEFCARESSQIFGGFSYTRSGKGERVERLYRDVRVWAIGGGTEEVMLDLGIRQAIKVAQLFGAKL
ncbi:hypothetical protein MIR68_006454 [Amoeboaphelidium protococcarum]|nr:hypothetical protein MIR68_006454 [Amoeboaphelidium protococcarum]